MRRHALGSSPRRPRPGRITIVAGATLTLIVERVHRLAGQARPAQRTQRRGRVGRRIRDGQARLGGSSACLQSAYCAAGCHPVYGINLGSGGIELETPEAIVEALSAGAIDVGALPSTAVEAADPRITILTDDRGLQPADNIIPVGPSGALVSTGGPALTAAVDLVSATLDQAGLDAVEQALAGGAPPDLAAQAWLQGHPLPFLRRPPARRAAGHRRGSHGRHQRGAVGSLRRRPQAGRMDGHRAPGGRRPGPGDRRPRARARRDRSR